MSKRTLFLIFALFLITFVLIMMALYQPQPKPAPTVSAPKEPAAQTILSFGNPSIATSSSVTTLNYSIPVNIDTSKNQVTTVQLEMQYDPEILTNVKVIPGPFFANPEVLLNQIDTETGRVSYAFGVGLTSSGVTGKGVVANVTFSTNAKTPQKTAIIFLPKTLVTAEGVSESVLKEVNAAQFTVGENNSATPSAPPVEDPIQ